MKGTPVLPAVEASEEEEDTGGLYPVMLPAKLLTRIAGIAKSQGVTTASLLAEALQQIIQNDDLRRRR